MNVAQFASRNGRAIALGVVLLTAAGFYSMFSLPSSIYPEVEFPRIVIVAKSGDLSPRLMQLAVTRPLEEAARAVLGVRRVRSKTIRGATEISVLFNPDADMRYALQLMQGKTDEVKPSLPAGTQLQVERMTPSIFPIFMFNLTGKVPAKDLRDLAEFEVRPLLSRVPGVANVEVLASEEREISVIVDPERLSAAKLTIDQVADALAATNQVNSVGRLAKDYRQYLVLATAELTSLDDVRNVVVAFRQQAPVYVRDLAEVREGVLDKTTLVSGDGQPAALVSVARQIHGNIIDVVDGARAAHRGLPRDRCRRRSAGRSSTTSRSSSRAPSTTCATRSSSAACSRSSSSSDSCATGGSRSSPPRPCRSRWWARSGSCTWPAARST